MDLLFSRYASPFVLIDSLIENNSLYDYVVDLERLHEEDRQWEFFLHKVFDQSWNEFRESMKPIKHNPIDLGATVNKSKNMLKNFTPEGGE